MLFHVLCFLKWVHGCGCLARAYGWLVVTGCWALGFVGGLVLRPQFGGGDLGSAKKLVQLLKKGVCHFMCCAFQSGFMVVGGWL